MRDPDTAMGGGAGRFPDTRHSAVLAARSRDPEVKAGALETIAAAYWKPAYRYLRVRWRLSNEESKDLVQEFFARAMERDLLQKYDASRGTFRGYLRVCLDSFVSNQRKAAGRQKRGGGAVLLPLETESAGGEPRTMEVSSGEDPESVFRREWIRGLFGQALDELHRKLAESGREDWFRIFELYEIGTEEHPGRPTYAELAARFGTTTTQITNHLAAARRELRRILLDRLREITAGEEEFRSEARELLGGAP